MRRFNSLPSRDYLMTQWVGRVPLHGLRMWLLRRLGLRIGMGSSVLMNVEFIDASAITIGDHTIINQRTHLDGRGGLRVGNNVNISSHVQIVAGTHDVQDGEGFGGEAKAVTIDDYVWICTRSLILPGVTVGRGAVVAAGSVVTRSVSPYTIVAGSPARPIGTRTQNLSYKLHYPRSWV